MIILLTVLSLLGCIHAQRPSNASTCDYYASQLYDANNASTQLQLIQGIVALAFGGAMNLTNGSNLTGILNPGTFNGQNVDLRPFFNGSKESTNLNNQPVGINWLDGGGVDPLYLYLSGQTSSIQISNSTNQYRLFGHFLIVFGHIFGCSHPASPLPGDTTTGSLPLAYIHKFMDLTYNDLGYFIDMLIGAAIHYGFTAQDAQTFNNNLNSQYNVRCAPPVTTAQGTQLYSLCQDPTCPLAEPSPNCAAYVNLTANGTTGGSNTGGAALPSSSTTSATSSTSTAATTTSAAPSSSVTDSSNSSPPLSGGAIGGIVVGGVAALGIFILSAVLVWHRRRRNPTVPSTVGTYTGSQMGETPKDGHASYLSNVSTAMATDDNTRHPSYFGPGPVAQSPDMSGRMPSPGWTSDQGFQSPGNNVPYSPGGVGQQVPHMSMNVHNPAELDVE